MSTLDDADLMAVMQTFTMFDKNGDGSLNREELTNLLYRISNDQSVEEVDEEVDAIMEACDRDKSGHISYIEYFTTQKKHDFGPKAASALEKLSKFMSLKEDDKKHILRQNNEQYNRLIQEKEKAIKEEKEETGKQTLTKSHEHAVSPKFADRNEYNPQSEVDKTESSLFTENPDLNLSTINLSLTNSKLHDDFASDLQARDSRISELEASLFSANETMANLSRDCQSKIDSSKLGAQLADQERQKIAKELESKIGTISKDLDTSRRIGEQSATEYKDMKIKYDKAIQEIESLYKKLAEQRTINHETIERLKLAEIQNKDSFEGELLISRLRCSEAEEKSFNLTVNITELKKTIISLSEENQTQQALLHKDIEDRNAQIKSHEEQSQKEALLRDEDVRAAEQMRSENFSLRQVIASHEQEKTAFNALLKAEKDRHASDEQTFLREATEDKRRSEAAMRAVQDDLKKNIEEHKKAMGGQKKLLEDQIKALQDKVLEDKDIELEDQKKELEDRHAYTQQQIEERFNEENRRIRLQVTEHQRTIQNLMTNTSDEEVKRDDYAAIMQRQDKLQEDLNEHHASLKQFRTGYIIWASFLVFMAFLTGLYHGHIQE